MSEEMSFEQYLEEEEANITQPHKGVIVEGTVIDVKDNEIILKVPVNVGIIGGIIGVATAPWALIAATVAAFGFGCKLEIVKSDGTTDELKF